VQVERAFFKPRSWVSRGSDTLFDHNSTVLRLAAFNPLRVDLNKSVFMK